MRFQWIAAAALVFAGLVVASGARAQDKPETGSSPAATPWEVQVGYRGGVVPSAGYDPFSTDEYFAQLTLGASRVVYQRGRLSLSAGAAWDWGHAGATPRGDKADLSVNRFTAPLTARWYLLPRAYVFARVAPGAIHQSASVQEPSAPASLVASGWRPCGDASVGAAYSFADVITGVGPLVWWVTADGGYGWAGAMRLSMSPDLADSDPRRTGPLDLGSLALSGPFGRLAVAMAF